MSGAHSKQSTSQLRTCQSHDKEYTRLAQHVAAATATAAVLLRLCLSRPHVLLLSCPGYVHTWIERGGRGGLRVSHNTLPA